MKRFTEWFKSLFYKEAPQPTYTYPPEGYRLISHRELTSIRHALDIGAVLRRRLRSELVKQEAEINNLKSQIASLKANDKEEGTSTDDFTFEESNLPVGPILVS